MRASKYKPEFCELLIRHMAEGFTFGSFAAVVKVNRDSLYEWANTHEEFALAKSLGESELLFFDEKIMRAIITGKLKNANITGLIFKFKNCHGWRDRHPDEVEKTIINNNVITEEAKEKLKGASSETLLRLVREYEDKAH